MSGDQIFKLCEMGLGIILTLGIIWLFSRD